MTAQFRYRKLGYVALNVSDVDRSCDFYIREVGLELSERDETGRVFLRCGPDHHNLILYPAAEPGLKRVAFELEGPEELEKARHHIERLGLVGIDIVPAELAQLRQGDGFRFQEPNSSLTFEYYTKMLQMALPYRHTHTKIARLGHVVLGVETFDETVAFVTQNLGFDVSDYVAGRFSFMRCHPNPLHHSFAIGKSPDGNRLHHVNFMVGDIDDIGCAMNRFKRDAVEIVFGPGRHQPSGSIFIYFLDPDGMTVEYSYGMEEFPEHKPRQPRMLEPRPEALDLWGSVPAATFAKVGAIEPPAVKGGGR